MASYLYLPVVASNLYLPALVPNLCLPALAPNWYLPALAPNLYLPALAPNLYLTVVVLNLCLPALAPNLYIPALAYNFVTSPGAEFTYTDLVSSICICIYGPGVRFELPVRGLVICIYLITDSSSSGSSKARSSNFFGIDNINITMPILVN